MRPSIGYSVDRDDIGKVTGHCQPHDDGFILSADFGGPGRLVFQSTDPEAIIAFFGAVHHALIAAWNESKTDEQIEAEQFPQRFAIAMHDADGPVFDAEYGEPIEEWFDTFAEAQDAALRYNALAPLSEFDWRVKTTEQDALADGEAHAADMRAAS